MELQQCANVNTEFNHWQDQAQRAGCNIYGGEGRKGLDFLEKLKIYMKWDYVLEKDGIMTFIAESKMMVRVASNSLYSHYNFWASRTYEVQKFFDFLRNISNPKIENGQIGVNVYTYSEKHGITSNVMILDSKERRKIINELYPNVDIKKLCEDYMEFDDSILILNGPPGVGKTTFVKFLMENLALGDDENPRPEIAYGTGVELFQQSEFWSMITAEAVDLLILDDVSQNMVRGKNSDNVFINNLLAYCDGVLHESAKVIITTNAEQIDFDPALTRPGRCFDNVMLRPLTLEEALNLWTKELELPKSSFPFKKNVVTQAELMYECNRAKVNKRPRAYMISDSKTSVKESIPANV